MDDQVTLDKLSDHDLLIKVAYGVERTEEAVALLRTTTDEERERVRALETRMGVAENDIIRMKKKATQDRWIEKALTIIGTAFGIHYGGPA